MKNYEFVHEFVTKNGLKATILLIDSDWHCGYVEVPKDFIIFGRGACFIYPELGLDTLEENTIAFKCDVHGGVTFSGPPYWDGKQKNGRWAFGFDCAHSGDLTLKGPDMKQSGYVWRDKDYCVEECEKLSEQLLLFNSKLSKSGILFFGGRRYKLTEVKNEKSRYRR